MRASYLYVFSSDAVVDKEINGVIADDLVSRRRSFMRDADNATAGSEDDLGTPNQMVFDIRCDEALSTTALLSIECKSYSDLGGAHPNDEHFAYNFGICAGKPCTSLTLAALCKPDASWKTTILDLIRQKLLRKLSTQGVEFLNLDDYSGALKSFAITSTGLRFFANDLPHVIASAAVIDIPFKQLSSILRRDGPLAALLPP
ncbi:MAG: hypothetical protein ABSC94_14010 [Polyangiaceae bacterium]